MTKYSNELTTLIRTEIETENGMLPFARFMALALYHPQLGYYSSPSMTIGAAGDFTTAAEISPLYAHCFSTQCQQVLAAAPNSRLLEIGAGTGRFAGDLTRHLLAAGNRPLSYAIYDISPILRAKQRQLISDEYPDVMPHIEWLETLPQNFHGIIIANEVLDALPSTCFCLENNTLQERFVTWRNDGFEFINGAPSAQLTAAVTPLLQHYDFPEGYASEINLALPDFIQNISAVLTQGVIFFADYGYGEREYYHPERTQGTLTCFYQHHRHANPLLHPGLQDMTTHVDFTRLITAAVDHGCQLGGYTTQAAFLLNCGLIQHSQQLEKNLAPDAQFHLHQAIKRLTLPMEMGERVKIMALYKNFDLPLLGFQTHDRRRDL